MITFTSVIALTLIICIYFAKKKEDWYGWHTGWMLGVIGFGIISLICVMIFIVNLYDSGSLEVKREMIIEQNKNMNELGQFERIEINKQIREFNDSLASYKYDRKGFFKNTVSSKIDEMEYIK